MRPNSRRAGHDRPVASAGADAASRRRSTANRSGDRSASGEAIRTVAGHGIPDGTGALAASVGRSPCDGGSSAQRGPFELGTAYSSKAPSMARHFVNVETTDVAGNHVAPPCKRRLGTFPEPNSSGSLDGSTPRRPYSVGAKAKTRASARPTPSTSTTATPTPQWQPPPTP